MNRLLQETYEKQIYILRERVEKAEEYARRAEEVEAEERGYKDEIRDLERRLRRASDSIPGFDMFVGDLEWGWLDTEEEVAEPVRKFQIVR